MGHRSPNPGTGGPALKAQGGILWHRSLGIECLSQDSAIPAVMFVEAQTRDAGTRKFPGKLQNRVRQDELTVMHHFRHLLEIAHYGTEI